MSQSRHGPSVCLSQTCPKEERCVGGWTDDGTLEKVRTEAAEIIQRHYRGHRTRRQLDGMGLDASQRWIEAMREIRWRKAIKPRHHDEASEAARSSMDCHTRARENWQRIGQIVRHAGHDDPDLDVSELSDCGISSESEKASTRPRTSEEREERRKRKAAVRARCSKVAKMMDVQYFLEMVDEKHRYGPHLHAYHEEWMKADTHENFFYWLDHGEGKVLDLPLVSRKTLDEGRIRYLSREERMQYLVKVDGEGRLCWAKNGERITTNTEWKDSFQGIVPRGSDMPACNQVSDETAEDLQEPNHQEAESTRSAILVLPSFNSHAIHDQSPRNTKGRHSEAQAMEHKKLVKKLHHITISTLLNRLLQMSVKPNSWIFVADTSFHLYVGIKQSGAFQHSSFLNGGRITAAGLIKIEDGQLRKLSPLSGHYRPPTKNFRQFHRSLGETGVDLSHLSISRSYVALLGLEAYAKTRGGIKKGLKHVTKDKDRALHHHNKDHRGESQHVEASPCEMSCMPDANKVDTVLQLEQGKSARPCNMLEPLIYIDDDSSEDGEVDALTNQLEELGATKACCHPLQLQGTTTVALGSRGNRKRRMG